MELSNYQKDIINYFRNNPQMNIKINALAGTGKSFILEKLSEFSTTYDVYVAFNNSIAKEFKERIKNPKTKIYTLHSLGLSIMNENLKNCPAVVQKDSDFGKNYSDKSTAVLDNLKIYKIIDDIAYENKLRLNFKELLYFKDNYNKLYNLIRLTKTNLNDVNRINRIIYEYNLFSDSKDELETPSESEIFNWISDIDKRSLALFDKNRIIDYTDMLYITYLKLESKEWSVPYWAQFTNIYVDECQDLSTLQLFFLKYIKRLKGRYIMVGDFYQSIYNFAGANANSFNLIDKLYEPIQKFELPINYRCPISHLKRVNKEFHIPIKASPSAIEGTIKEIQKSDIIKYVEPGDMIISRKNKWLSSVILDLADYGIPFYMADKESAELIKEMIRNIKATSIKDFKKKINKKKDKYKEEIHTITSTNTDDNDIDENELSKTINSNDCEKLDNTSKFKQINDKLDNVQFIINLLNSFEKKNPESNDFNDFVTYVEHLINTDPSKESVRVSSVHKAKGLEADKVFVLNKAKICEIFKNSHEQKQQEVNLSYISMTRSKNILYLVEEPSEENKESEDD